jgi:hypothetical protein
MKNERKSAAPTALAIFAIVVVPLAIYAAAYCWLGEYQEDTFVGRVDHISRSYPREWIVTVFRPAAQVEEWLRGVTVTLSWSG